MTSRHYIHIHRMEWKVLIRCVGGAAVGSGWRWWMNLRKRMPDNTGGGGEGNKFDTRAQASVCCVGMYPLPACSTHVACVGVLWRYRLCKCDCEWTRCHRRLDDVHFGTWKTARDSLRQLWSSNMRHSWRLFLTSLLSMQKIGQKSPGFWNWSDSGARQFNVLKRLCPYCLHVQGRNPHILRRFYYRVEILEVIINNFLFC